jgi:hypothetical protein
MEPLSHPLVMIGDMRGQSLVAGDKMMEQPRLLTVPEEPKTRAELAGDEQQSQPLGQRSEAARRLGLSGVAKARAALAAASERAEVERAAARAARKAA